MRVLNLTTAHDCGQPTKPMLAEGQLHGSVHMAVGRAVSQNMLFQGGNILNPCFADYKLLRLMDSCLSLAFRGKVKTSKKSWKEKPTRI